MSKTNVIGKKLFEQLMARNYDHGGDLVEITGAQGTSKTSCLLTFCSFTMEKFPNEKNFFREQVEAPLQIFKLGEKYFDKIDFFIKESSNAVFRNRNKRLKEVDLPHQTFKTYDELYDDLSIRGHVSVPIFNDNYEWMDFIHYLRGVGEWVSVYVDEMGDVAPASQPNPLGNRIGSFAQDMGAIRRCMMKLFYNTQSAPDIDYRVRNKVMSNIFFRGAKVSPQKHKVKQQAINTLQVNPILGNEAWIEKQGDFGKIRFTQIFKPHPRAHFEVYVPESTTQKTQTTNP